MAPKKEVPAAPVADTCPYGVFINVEVQSFFVSYAPHSNTEGSLPPVLPSTHLSVSYPGPYAPVTGSPAVCDPATGEYVHNFQQCFRCEASLAALEALLNSPPVLNLHDSATGTVLASCPLDLTAFGLGQQQLSLSRVQLQLTDAAGCIAPPAQPSSGKPATPPGAAGKKGAKAPEEPPAPVPEPARILSPVTLPSLRLFLTHRPAPDSTAASEGGSTTAESAQVLGRPASKQASRGLADCAQALEGGAVQLPEPLPYRFVPEDEVGKTNVLTWHLTGPGPLPASYVAASDAAPGKLSLNAALCLPAGAGAPLVMQRGMLVKATSDAATGAAGAGAAGAGAAAAAGIMWPGNGCVQRVLRAAEVEALVAALDSSGPGESALGVELSRSVAEDKSVAESQAAWQAYHGWAPLPGAICLLEGGTTAMPAPSSINSTDSQVETSSLQAWPSTPSQVSALPAYTAPTGKFKAVEEVAAGVTSAWAAAGSSLSVRLSFAQPLVPAWVPPPAPEPPLQALVPQRVLHPPPPPTTAAEELQNKLTSMLHELAAVYKQQQHQGVVIAATPAGPPEVVHKQLIKQLNTSGQYESWREALKSPLLRVVKEQLSLTGSMRPEDMSGTSYGDLYKVMTDTAHAVLHAASDTQPAPPPATEPPPSPSELIKLLHLARECEVVNGDARRAAALHRRRRLDRDNAQVHVDAASAACRRAAAATTPCAAVPYLQEAAAALRAALEIDPHHTEALTTTALVHTTLAVMHGHASTVSSSSPQVRHTDSHKSTPQTDNQQASVTPCDVDGNNGPGVLARNLLQVLPARQDLVAMAVAAGHVLKEVQAGSVQAWLLLYLAYTAAGDELAGQNVASCMYELKRVQRADLTDQPPSGIVAAGLMSVWQQAVELGLTPMADQLMNLASGVFRRSVESYAPMQLQLYCVRSNLLKAESASVYELPTQQHLIAVQESVEGAQNPQGSSNTAQAQVSTLLDAATGNVKNAHRMLRQLQTEAAAKHLEVQQAVEQTTTARDAGGDVADAVQGVTAEQAVQEEVQDQQATAAAGTAATTAIPTEAAQTAAAAAAGNEPLVQKLEVALLRGDIAWARAQQLTHQQEADGSCQNEDSLAAAAEQQQQFVNTRAEARRAYQEALQLLSDMGLWLHAAAAKLQPAAGQGSDQQVSALQQALPDASSSLLLQLERGLLRLSTSYMMDDDKPQCALDVATGIVQLWPHSCACWSAAAQAAAAVGISGVEVVWSHANVCDVWDGRVWEQVAACAFQRGRYTDGVSAMHQALALLDSYKADPTSSTAVPPDNPLSLLQAAAHACLTAGQYEAAAEHLRTALHIGGADVFQVQALLVEVQAALGNASAAHTTACTAQRLAATPIQLSQVADVRQQLMAV